MKGVIIAFGLALFSAPAFAQDLRLPSDPFSAYDYARLDGMIRTQCGNRGEAYLMASREKATGRVEYGLIVSIDGLRAPGRIISANLLGGRELATDARDHDRIRCFSYLGCRMRATQAFKVGPEDLAVIENANQMMAKVFTSDGGNCAAFVTVSLAGWHQVRDAFPAQ